MYSIYTDFWWFHVHVSKERYTIHWNIINCYELEIILGIGNIKHYFYHDIWVDHVLSIVCHSLK